MEERRFGFKKSEIDGTERIFSMEDQYTIPESYSYREFLPKVLDQGSLPICVPCSLSAYINWKLSLKDGNSTDKGVDLLGIFNGNSLEGEGMAFKEAFKVCRTDGANTNEGNVKIGHYGMIRNSLSLKYALVMNGPCFGALPVYSSDREFWNKKYGDDLVGYHAISITGYDNKGFYIRNSWGKWFGDKGYTYIKNEDFNKFLELWTVID